MSKKIFRKIITIIAVLILSFNVDNINAANAQEVAKINPTICEKDTGNYIPTGGESKLYSQKAFFLNDINYFKGIYYCVSKDSDGGGIGFTYFKLNPNPTKKIFFPVIYWDKKNNPNKYSTDLLFTFTNAYKGGSNYKQEKKEILGNIEQADKSYAKSECEKYCNACHLTKDEYAYYDLKKNYYTYSPLNFKGEGDTWSNFGWNLLWTLSFKWNWDKVTGGMELFDNSIDECSKPENDYCNGKILFVDNETLDKLSYTLQSEKKCWNYIDDSGDRYWLCEVLADCEVSCLGQCISPKEFYSKTKSYIGALEKDVEAYYCLGTKNRNTKFKNGDSTEDKKYFTSDYNVIKAMDKYDGDKIPASLGNIYSVGTGKITCEDVFGKGDKGQLSKILREIFKYIRIAAVGLFVIFTSLDFIKAIAGSDDSPIKKASKNLTKRFVILLILLILPTLVNIVLSIVEIKNGLCFLN